MISSVAAVAGQHGVGAAATPQAPGTAHARAVVVYVSDFDLDVIHGKQATTVPSESATHPTGVSAASQKEETLEERANALVDGISEALVKALGKAGYKVHRLRPGETRPSVGMQISGVFADSDEQNRIRRLLVGGAALTPKMLLFVGVQNLARPAQPIYALADPPSPDARFGPVISVSAYPPVSRFELDRNPAPEDLKKIAAQVTESFNALLTANPAATSP
ncbi:MAG TPA: DUF4410 domain-containing protein [Candidatus Solibacter sp.]|nr:DUF4410 domain-containing protein [Candidatus Solibacter sp.]